MPDDHTQLILGALRQAAWPRTTSALAATTGLPVSRVVKLLDKLAAQGAVQRVRRGEYRLPGEG